jgi:ATP-dependent RNA helicase DeaD
MGKRFEDFKIEPRILKAIRDMGFEEPTPVQEETIPLMLEGTDVMAQAQTGTGKTAAFGIPIIQLIKPEKKPLALIIVPTRELATQVAEEIDNLAKYSKVRSLAVYGGQSINVQIQALEHGREIIVGTPGRLIDHIRRRTLKLGEIQFVVLDEADRMLDMGFIEDIEYILKHVKKGIRTSLFSATIPPEVRRLAKSYIKDPKTLIVSEDELTVPSTEQAYISVGRKNKIWALCRILDKEKPKAIVFCSTKRMVDILVRKLQSYGYSAEPLHGDLTQAKREKILKDFKNGKTNVLIASDVAARGLDIDNVTHVINYDIPDNPEVYVHRIGRTGRAGHEGKAITFVSTDEKHLLKNITDFAKSSISEADVPQKKGKDLVRRVWDFDEMSDIFGMVKFRINLGSKDGMKFVDIGDFVMAEGGASNIAIGNIEVGEEESIVEVHKDYAERMIRRLRKVRFKGKDIRAQPFKD